MDHREGGGEPLVHQVAVEITELRAGEHPLVADGLAGQAGDVERSEPLAPARDLLLHHAPRDVELALEVAPGLQPRAPADEDLPDGRFGAAGDVDTAVITLWFDKKRGRNMGLALMGIGIGGLAFSPLAAWIIQQVGWRATYRLQAATLLVFVIPPVLMFLKNKPSDIGEVPDGLAEAAANPRNHRYSQSRGLPNLRRAVADRYRRRFGVELDPETEVINTIGAKEGLSHLLWTLVQPGDVALVPEPSYPIHIYAPVLAGADEIGNADRGYETCIKHIVCALGDTDTNAAVAGAVLGALAGSALAGRMSGSASGPVTVDMEPDQAEG